MRIGKRSAAVRRPAVSEIFLLLFAVTIGAAGHIGAALAGVTAVTSASCLSSFSTSGGNVTGDTTAIAPDADIFTGTCANRAAPGTFGTASATASGNLANGESKIDIKADGDTAAFAQVILSDLLTITPTAGFSAAFFDATVQLDIVGDITGNADGGGTLQLQTFYGQFQFGGVALCTAAAVVCAPLAQTPGGAQHQIITGTVPVSSDSPFLFVQDFVFGAVNCINSNCLQDQAGETDFAHTGHLSLTLPPGFTYTSNSGVFLSDVPSAPGSPVPEPATVSLVLIALGGLAASNRRKRRQ